MLLRCLIGIILLLMLAACGTTAQSASTPEPASEGRRIFGLWCGGCHAVTANAPAGVGPGLAGIATRAATKPDGLSATAWLRREVVDPNAAVTPGYTPGFMPTTYGRDLRPDQLDALVAYMLTLQ